MKKLLITGGAGFIGSNFIRYILNRSKEFEVSNLDALTYAGNPENLKSIQEDPRYKFFHGNISDPEFLSEVFSKDRLNAVIHFAAESHVDRSIENPLAFIETNVLGTANLLRFSYNYWLNLPKIERGNFRFIHISTDEVFGSLLETEDAFNENSPYAPNSPYAASKAASDLLVRAYFQTYQFPAITINCSNNYGPYQFPEKLIPLVITNAREGKEIPVYGDGKQIRDWLFVEDHCEAICSILEKGKTGETYNIGGNNQWQNIDIILKICEIMDRVFPNSPYCPHQNLISHVNDRPGHDRRYAMDTNKASEEIGWQPKTNFEEGLEKTVHWYLTNENWLQDIQKKPSYDQWLEKNYSNRGKQI